MGLKIFVINPGGGSTKVALFEDEKLLKYKEIRHPVEELKKFLILYPRENSGTRRF
jgi:butyrate kinase